MNILILFTQPWRTGGAETHVEAMLKGLYSHRIFLAVNEGSNIDKLKTLERQYANLKIVTIQSRGINIFKWIQSISYLKQLVRDEHIDIIAAQQRTAGIWAWRIGKSTGIKYTVTMHDPWHRAKFKSMYHKIFPEIIVVSGNLANVLEKEYNFKRDNINLLNNGVDFAQFKPMDKLFVRDKLHLPKDEKIILHVSRMSAVKGAVSLVLLEALELLAKKNIFYKTIIIGEGPFRSKVEECAQQFNNKYGKWIIIKDFVPDITLWYNATDILVGEGRVAIETLACEKPVIAIRNSNYFIGLITPQNIAYACDVNFDGKDKEAKGYIMSNEIEKAFKLDYIDSVDIAKYVRNNLSIEKMIEAYMKVFGKLLQENKRIIVDGK